MKNLWLLLSIIALFAVFVQSDDPHKPVRKPIDWTNPRFSIKFGKNDKGKRNR
ncbi:hypothetical protein Smp_120280 [Schistosoma mansoni]|uniref:hypothetical protein n=1 Tax=Schistosoma mansoni TaxID=6183 RepID=UPI00022DC8AA|nr:hypothetical protein Smp_120280 [Schistosoma mansoni]|eukprot:XP_018649572.1 hypothetical protein Smp_120280 [Schistosoma mansoni]